MLELRLQGIGKRYGNSTIALHHVDLTINEGELFCLLGPSGCGKTTLLKLVAGLLIPDKGQVFLGDQNITEIPAEKRGFGMVFQQALLFPHMTVEENVAFGLKMQGISKHERLNRAREMLASVGLEGYGARNTAELSGGQQQRVTLARALVPNPRLLLMDEPFSALDPELREEMRELVSRLHREHRVTILFVTHDREEAFMLADRIGVMKNGRLLQVGSTQALYENPFIPEVAMFLGARNVIPGTVQEGTFISEDGSISLQLLLRQENQHGWLVLRPEILRAADHQLKRHVTNSKSSYLSGIIRQVTFRQGFYHLKVEVETQMLDVMQQGEEGFHPLVGETITLNYDANKVHFISEHTLRRD